MAGASLPPARPTYVFRGHASQVHAVGFSPLNHRLLTGDAEGWVVSWSLSSKRPEASWRAHGKAVLGLAWWGLEAIISHGRDGKLLAWQLGPADEATLPKDLPLEHLNVPAPTNPSNASGKPPVLLELTVNTLNFCAFAAVPLGREPPRTASEPADGRPPLLLAVPHTLESEAIDVHVLPGGKRCATIPPPALAKPATGLLMALAFAGPDVLISGYEGGHVLAYARDEPGPESADDGRLPSMADKWSCIYRSRPHAQPVLSLASFPSPASSEDPVLCISTAADAVVARHRLARRPTPKAGATAEEIPRAAVDLPEVAAALIFRTGHAGQQGARVRDDGRICATAGWDGRVRVYASATLREKAVLKWHKEGCFAVDFASVHPPQAGPAPEADAAGHPDIDRSSAGDEQGASREGASDVARAGVETVVRTEPTLAARRREARVRSKHWLAAGSKDGKVSLWEIF